MSDKHVPQKQPASRSLHLRIGFSLIVFSALAVFGYWYAALPYESESRKKDFSLHKTDRAVYEDELTKKHDVTYPALDDPRQTEKTPATDVMDEEISDNRPGEEDSFNGTRMNLFRYLPADSLVYAYLDLEIIRKERWLRPILNGKQFPWFLEQASYLGVDLNATKQITAAFDRGSSSVFGVNKLGHALKGWKNAMKSSFCMAAEIDHDRQKALRLFSESGALTANIILGHRVYHKDPGYFLALPGRSLLLASFRRPMANLLGLLVGRTDASAKSTESINTLKKMLEDGPETTVFAMVSNPENMPASRLKVPGGGTASDAGFTVSILDSDLHFRWFMQLDSPRSAKRFIFRAKRFVDEYRLKYWVRITGLSKSLNEIVFERKEDQVVTELRLPHAVCEAFLNYFKNR